MKESFVLYCVVDTSDATTHANVLIDAAFLTLEEAEAYKASYKYRFHKIEEIQVYSFEGH